MLVARSVLRTGATQARLPVARVAAQSQARFMASEAFGQDLVHERQHHKEHAGKSGDLWRKVSLYACIPFAIVMSVYIGKIESEHLHHRDHEIEENGGELPETTKYDFNDIRKKPFPWAKDGKDNSFFWNAKANRSVDL